MYITCEKNGIRFFGSSERKKCRSATYAVEILKVAFIFLVSAYTLQSVAAIDGNSIQVQVAMYSFCVVT